MSSGLRHLKLAATLILALLAVVELEAAQGPGGCSSPDHYVNEAVNPRGPHRCSDDCECDGARQCSDVGWCSGVARVAAAPAPSPSALSLHPPNRTATSRFFCGSPERVYLDSSSDLELVQAGYPFVGFRVNTSGPVIELASFYRNSTDAVPTFGSLTSLGYFFSYEYYASRGSQELRLESSWGLASPDRVVAISVCCGRDTPSQEGSDPEPWQLRFRTAVGQVEAVGGTGGNCSASAWEEVPPGFLLAGVVWQSSPADANATSSRLAFIYAEPHPDTWAYAGPFTSVPSPPKPPPPPSRDPAYGSMYDDGSDGGSRSGLIVGVCIGSLALAAVMSFCTARARQLQRQSRGANSTAAAAVAGGDVEAAQTAASRPMVPEALSPNWGVVPLHAGGVPAAQPPTGLLGGWAQGVEASKPAAPAEGWAAGGVAVLGLVLEPCPGAGGLQEVVTAVHVPPAFVCPITQDVMSDPCVAADGFTYERAAIATWLERAAAAGAPPRSPLTNLPLPHAHVVPNMLLRQQIDEWRRAQQAQG
ncbi:hypothetical protein HYH03_010373 [Edaphochlamys debaryana]|uniref:U-box domain-containing protein n=1 Tax=Edaphochlamys debaryana TaxID=47281 RepID=A0A835XZN7_9CHLO|nr:hypothetical protein HYH03_010373 [Edaphochlamys debaryana]|eukprot:KAG2491376.1 hypothetical protein HYH03_010373 [Edaphochlamys debaryana]